MQRHPILIVEDDPGVRILMGAVLDHEGYEYEDCSDGVNAIEKLRQTEYSAVILDLMIPRFSGFEILRYLAESRPDLLKRVIVVSAVSERRLREIDAESVCGVLRKPFDLDNLRVLIREALKRDEDSVK